jgi:hypothetical protein
MFEIFQLFLDSIFDGDLTGFDKVLEFGRATLAAVPGFPVIHAESGEGVQ